MGMRIVRHIVAAGMTVAGCDPVEEGADDSAAMDSATDGQDDGAQDDGAQDDGAQDDGAQDDGGDDPLGAVAAHNDVRRTAEPTPTPPLPDMVWDENLAAVATAWAQGCVFEHSTNEFGENLYIGSGTPTATDAVVAWASEIADYDYASNGCSGVCGHYTQIVWRDTTRVGCGFADCDSVVGVNFSGRIWVCNYDPPGNFVGQQPY